MAHPHVTEDSLIDRFRGLTKSLRHKPSAGRPLILGIGDDAALFRPRPAYDTILTCDWFLEGTHFLRDKHPPDSVGWKCLARTVSDVAAMGGTPRCFLLSLAVPASLTGRWLEKFHRGLGRASRKFQCILAGGDTTRRDEILINISVVAEVRPGRALLRSRARPGDHIFVSGHLGEAERGFQLLMQTKKAANLRNPLLGRHLYPEPRLALGQWLGSKRLATAMMDLSDGLSSDLPRLCAASGVGARVEASRIRAVHIPARHLKGKADPIQLALHGGDDYELLFTVPPRRVSSMPNSFQGVALTEIGVVTTKRQVVLAGLDGREHPLQPRGWDPFRERC